MGRRKKKAEPRKLKRTSQPSSHVDAPGEFDSPMEFAGALPGGIPNQRALEGLMRQFVADEFGGAPDDSPLAAAQQLVGAAADAQDLEQRIQMAQQALAISPDCADAYVLLGEHAESPQAALEMYEQAVAAGRRALGEQVFEELAGHFWGFLETRPYMRARFELAMLKLYLGKFEEAVAELQDMLRLNPNDNQGVRYILLAELIQLDRDDAALALIDEYDEDASAEWRYGRALLSFRRDGDVEASRKLLAEATSANAFVPAYLVGAKDIPSRQPPYVSPGEDSEAQSYASAYLRCWKATPGAIPWLRHAAGVVRREPDQPRQRSWSGFPPGLADLPQDQVEVWHVDVRRVSAGSSSGDANVWVVFVTSPSREQVLATEFVREKPSNQDVLQLLGSIMAECDDDEPRRPAALHVRLKTFCNSWTKRLAAIGIGCEQVPQLEDIDAIHDEIVARTEQQMERADMPVLGDDELRELPQVAEEVWQVDVRRVATWFGDETNPVRPWFAIVANCSDGTVLAHELTTDEPQDDWLMGVIRQAMSNPAIGDSRRPGKISVCEVAVCDALQEWLDACHVDCDLHERLDLLDFLYDDFTERMCGEEPAPALLDASGVEPRHVAGVFDAAAEFYRRKPWRMIPGDVPLKIECDGFESGLGYAVVMGQAGMCEGISLYEDYDELTRMLSGLRSDAENAETMSVLAVQFNEPWEIPNLDLHHAEKYGWPIAGPEAYPTIIRVEPGMEIRPPLVDELCLMEACLRAVPHFLTAAGDEPAEFEVDTFAGKVKVSVSWP